MNKFKIALMALAAAGLLALLSTAGLESMTGPVGTACAQSDWKMEFDAVCARTQDSGAIPTAELKDLVVRCDKLRPHIEKLDESQRKVFLKRLQMCRNLFAFVLESRDNK